jgi:rhamnogalacturonan endolyase
MRIVWTLFIMCALAGAAEKFVLVRGGETRPGEPASRIEDFEISTHPVTNAEYALFVTAAKFPAPLHWQGGAIPAGMENHPVIFVNRYDAAEYLKWRSKKEGRLYRLPTASEFEFAARGGVPGNKFPWGDGSPQAKANYDATGTRTFAEWRQHIKPVDSFAPNALGLYDMAGNVWQMIDTYPDAAIVRFKYRITKTDELESSVAGGSWARSEYYLRCGVRGGASPGIRHPDLGFRIVREPAGSSHFRTEVRRLVVTPAVRGGGIFVSWQILPGDAAGAGFHVYRSTRRDTAGQRLTREAITGSTNFVDRSAPEGRAFYRVRKLEASGKEGPPSEWSALLPEFSTAGLAMRVEPTSRLGGFIPVFGDLTGDGVLDVVMKLANGIQEMSRDPGVPVELEAFTSYGRQLWRRPMMPHDQCYGSVNNAPNVVWDMDGDGKSEVVARVYEDGKIWLAILDGMTGKTLRRTPWTAMATDFSKSSTRIHMSIAYLDGKTPAVITQTGLYENEIFDAYDAKLTRLWQYKSFAETNGSGSHHIDIADVDGDGRDEVFNGTMVLNPDGKLRWAIYREHPDIVAIKHILPGSMDRQVYYAVESSMHAGAYVVEAKTGKIIWKSNREDDPRWSHAHIGWAADIFDRSPGMEMLTNRDGHEAKLSILFAADGKVLAEPFPSGWYPVNWTGGATRDLMNTRGDRIGRFDGKQVLPLDVSGALLPKGGGCRMVADLVGDYRDEIVCTSTAEGGGPVMLVFTNTEAIERRDITRAADREYRLWLARNQGGGYGSYFEWQPGAPRN